MTDDYDLGKHMAEALRLEALAMLLNSSNSLLPLSVRKKLVYEMLKLGGIKLDEGELTQIEKTYNYGLTPPQPQFVARRAGIRLKNLCKKCGHDYHMHLFRSDICRRSGLFCTGPDCKCDGYEGL